MPVYCTLCYHIHHLETPLSDDKKNNKHQSISHRSSLSSLITMNIHPLIVHFPIALLTLYSLLELASLGWRAWTKKLETTKIFLLWIGTIGAFFSLQSGELAEEFRQLKGSELVHTHEEFAEKAYSTYITLSIYYLVIRAMHAGYLSRLPSKINTLLTRILAYSRIKRIVALWAALWLGLLTITGALGGAITHGPDIDPVVQMIYTIFVWK